MSNQFLEELKSIDNWIICVRENMNVLGEKIKGEFDLPQLKADLLALPEQIKKTQIIALQKKAELSEVEQQMKQREAGILFEINDAKTLPINYGDNAKLKFSNEPARKAELIRRLGKDESHLALKANRSAIEFKVWEFEAEVDRLRNDLRSRIAIKDLIVAELNLYTK